MKKLSGTQYKAIRDDIRAKNGFDSKSIVWGRTTLDVLVEVQGATAAEARKLMQALLIREKAQHDIAEEVKRQTAAL